jgi:hypothetical protein
MQTGKTMCIQISKVQYIAKREIAGKHVKADPGRKAMYRQRERQILTGVLKVQLVQQHEHLRQHQLQQLEAQPRAAVLPAAHLKEVAITGVERAAAAIRAVVSWVVNHRLAAKEVSEPIHIRRASSSRKKVRQVVQGAQAQKARLVKLPREVAADQKAVPEASKGVNLPNRIS